MPSILNIRAPVRSEGAGQKPREPRRRPEHLLTVNDVYEELDRRIGKNRVYELVRSGDLPAKRIGSQYFVARRSLDAWLDEVETPQSHDS